MGMEGELIYVAIIMQIGTILTILIWKSVGLSTYFKKENFKTGLATVRATNKLNLKKLERELGLTGSKNSLLPSDKKSPVDKLGQLSPFLPLISKLDKDQLGALIDHFIEGGFNEDRGDEGGGTIGGILEFADEHPDIVESFLGGLGAEKDTSESQKSENY